MKKVFLKLLFFPCLTVSKTNKNQQRARETEWDSIKPYLKKERFLDVGCGAGYAMCRAKNDFDCSVVGIDPEPSKYGVGRNETAKDFESLHILKGFADNLPFDDNSFGIIYSSHVLEHIHDKDSSLIEMKRVLKEDGVLIIGMPTSAMAVVNLLTNYIFLTHIKIVSIALGRFFNLPKYQFRHIFLPVSHSFESKSVYSDIREYRVSNWNKIISRHFLVKKIILPALYPYPEYIQFFPFIKKSYFSSSVFFICSK